MKYTIASLLLAMCVAGCASKRFSEFSGQQAWPTTKNAMADSSYAVPVYLGWPERPFRVIGSIRFADPKNEWKDGDTEQAARMAKERKGDAMIMRYGGEFGVHAITGAASDPSIVSLREITALVIQWKPDSEINAERNALQQFAADYKAKHPGIELRTDLLETAAEYVALMGTNTWASGGTAALEGTLNELLISKAPGTSTKWLFRGTLRSTALTSSATESVYGIATLTQTAETVTLISTSGKVDVNFSGLSKDGRLSGQLGFSGGRIIFSGKAEGVIVGDKISLNSQGQTTDGTVQASFTFLR